MDGAAVSRNAIHQGFTLMATRTFTTPDGTPWQAWDVVPGLHADWPEHARRHLPEVLSDGWLCFESAHEKRRLHPIPQAWDSRSEGELSALCDTALPVPRRLQGATE
jgi:hypothetical protein